MSDHTLTFLSTVGEWVIVAIMLYEMRRSMERGSSGTAARPFWRWAAIALIAIAMWIPIYLVSRGESVDRERFVSKEVADLKIELEKRNGEVNGWMDKATAINRQLEQALASNSDLRRFCPTPSEGHAP